jgi:hypothetical protein
MKTMQQGAYTALHVATSPTLRGEGGRYYVHCEPQTPSRAALDRAAAKRLWEVSAELTGC